MLSPCLAGWPIVSARPLLASSLHQDPVPPPPTCVSLVGPLHQVPLSPVGPSSLANATLANLEYLVPALPADGSLLAHPSQNHQNYLLPCWVGPSKLVPASLVGPAKLVAASPVGPSKLLAALPGWPIKASCCLAGWSIKAER